MTDRAGREPILVTGSHRSGTTWVGRMLSLSPDVVMVHEPFHPHLAKSWLRTRAGHWLQYVGPENGHAFARDVGDILRLRPPAAAMVKRSAARELGGVTRELLRARWGAVRRSRPLLKDPLAFFAAEWLAQEFSAQVVVLVRHPAAFTSSIKRLNWTFDFSNLVEQPALVRRYLRDYEAEIEAAARDPLDVVGQAILLWRCMAATALRYRAAHPDWQVLRYEDLAADALGGFAAMYATLGLPWTRGVASRIEAYTGSSNLNEVATGDKGGVRRNSRAAMWTWRQRLTLDEIERVREGTSDVAERWYGTEEWVPPAAST